MRARTIPILLVLVLMAVPAPALGGATAPGSADPGHEGGDGGVTLWFKAGAFDPLTDPVPGPGWLHVPSTHPYYVIQFDGPVLPAWRDRMLDLGVDLLAYMPDHAFFARVPQGATDDLRDVPHVRYVGPVHPAYRIHPVLFQYLRGNTRMDLDLLLWDAAAARDVADRVTQLGGRVLRVDWDDVTVELKASSVLPLVADPGLGIRWVEPHYDIVMLNDNDARTVNARQTSDGTYVSNDGSLWSYNPTDDTFEGYTGENVTVTVADTGLSTDHPAFDGRIAYYYDYGNDGEHDADGHGTHVSGTVLGNGSWRASDVGPDGKYAGLAPEAMLVVQEVFVAGNPGANGMGRDADNAGATISSNSWISGYFGDYNGQCEAYDRLTHDANNVKPGEQPIFYVFGAGNDGPNAGSIRPPSLAKNVLSVGSVGNDRWGASSSLISGFSSRGPVEDGRIKPDVLTPGHVVSSTKSSYPGANAGYSRPPDGQNSYVYASGTSMATPGAAGSAAVVTQYIRDEFDHEPSPALLKAILINGAVPLSAYDYPDMNQGWGRVDLERSLLETDTYKIWREDQEVDLDMEEGSNEQSYWFLVSSGEELKITLTWSDVPGQVSAEKHLINDLDLVMTGPDGKVYSGNNFTGGYTDALDNASNDRVNNVEGIRIKTPTTGLWNLKVRAFNVPTGSQSYALVVSGDAEKGHVDLLPDVLTAAPSGLEEGHQLNLTSQVRNVGNRNASAVDYRLEQEHPSGQVTLVDSGSLGAMVPDAEADLQWTVTGERGTSTFRLIVDPGGSVLESDEDNNVAQVQYFFKGFDVGLTPAETSVRADPGRVVPFELTLHNGGNVPDELMLQVTDPPPGWQVGLVKDSYTLTEGESTKVILDVMVPSNATAGERASVAMTAVSSGNGTKRATVTVDVEVNHVFGMEAAAVSPSQDMLPGEDRTLELLIRNTGNGEDTFVIDLVDPQELTDGWWVSFPETHVTIPLRSEVKATLVLTAPDRAMAGASVEFRISASSSGASLRKEVGFSATVVQFYDTQVVVERLVTAGDAGQTIVIPLSISNGGNGPVMYSGDINFPDATWSGGLDIDNLTLAGYADARANLTFTVPQDAVNRSYDFTLIVISSGGEVHLKNFTFAVRQYHDLRLTIISDPPTVTQGEQAWVRFTVENLGNGVEEVSLTSEAPSTWTFEFNDGAPVLEPFSQAMFEVRFDTELNTIGGAYDTDILAYYGPSKMDLVRATATVNVVTRPDLSVASGDLNVSEPTPYVDTLVRITSTVRNEGQTVARDVFVQLYVDGVPSGQPQYVSSIEPGGEETLTFVWTTNASGLRELRVVADYQDDIDEPNEANNEASTTVEVQKVDLKTSPGLTAILVMFALSIAVATAVARDRVRRGRDPSR